MTPRAPGRMRAMEFRSVGAPLELVERDAPTPTADQLLLQVEACGVCRTDLHLLDGEVAIASPPRVLGHQIVGPSMATLGASVIIHTSLDVSRNVRSSGAMSSAYFGSPMKPSNASGPVIHWRVMPS